MNRLLGRAVLCIKGTYILQYKGRNRSTTPKLYWNNEHIISWIFKKFNETIYTIFLFSLHNTDVKLKCIQSA